MTYIVYVDIAHYEKVCAIVGINMGDCVSVQLISIACCKFCGRFYDKLYFLCINICILQHITST